MPALVSQDKHEERVQWEGLNSSETTPHMARSVVLCRATRRQPTGAGSISLRVAALFASQPNMNLSEPCVDRSLAGLSSLFDTPELQQLLRFIDTTGGCGLSHVDQLALVKVFLSYTEGKTSDGTSNADRSPMANTLVSSIRNEQTRVLAVRIWFRVLSVIGERKYIYYYRDMLESVLDRLRKAEKVILD